MTINKRDFLAIGGAAIGLGALGGGAFALWPRPKMAFAAVKDPAGFRRMVTQSGGLSSFVTGVDLTAKPQRLSASALCDIAFGGQEQAGRLVIAAFSDFFCPYCRVLDQQVHDIVRKDARITLVPHQVPLLGRASDMAARGGIAAQQQGAYEAYFKRLIRTTFVPTPAYLRDFARTEGLDIDRFIAGLNSDETNQTLAQSAAAYRAFGFVGTPGLAVGRTLINGVVSRRELRSICAMELELATGSSCIA